MTEREPIVIRELHLTDFRNYENQTVSPGRGINIISGQNAQGKTNCLEAIALLSTGRLMRGSKDALAIRDGAQVAQVTATLDPTGSELSVRLATGTRKKVAINGVSLPRASDVIGRLPTIAFSSQDLGIATGEPSDRRHFLDTELAQLYPAYLRHLTVYRRALDQRNALLRQAQEGSFFVEAFEAWEDQLIEHGNEMRRIRSEWIDWLNPVAEAAHQSLAPGETFRLTYQPREQDLASALAHRREDVARGTTTSGPHRDELLIEIGGRAVRHFGSQGQQRTTVISLKLAVLESARQIFGFPPVLLFDDVFSDLDQHRRTALVSAALNEGGQVFLTCTEASQAGGELLRSATIFLVESGRMGTHEAPL